MSPDDEGHLAAPGVDEAGPAGVQGDVVSVLTAQAHRRVLEWRLASVLQNCAEEEEQTTCNRDFINRKKIL